MQINRDKIKSKNIVAQNKKPLEKELCKSNIITGIKSSPLRYSGQFQQWTDKPKCKEIDEYE